MKEIYVFVVFNKGGYQYIYRNKANCKVGDVVEAPTCNYAISQKALVTKSVKLADCQLPIDKDKILDITKILQEDSFLTFDSNKSLKNKIDKNLIKEWRLINKTSWYKFYATKNNCKICLEKDGVLTCSIGDAFDDNYIEEYTIIKTKKYNFKLKYVKTLVSQLYYNMIDKKTFGELLQKVD